jgi:hypothetical protein
MTRPLLRVVAGLALIAAVIALPTCTSTGSTPVHVGVSVRYGYGYGPGWGYGWGGGYYPAVPIGPPIYRGPVAVPLADENN